MLAVSRKDTDKGHPRTVDVSSLLLREFMARGLAALLAARRGLVHMGWPSVLLAAWLCPEPCPLPSTPVPQQCDPQPCPLHGTGQMPVACRLPASRSCFILQIDGH